MTSGRGEPETVVLNVALSPSFTSTSLSFESNFAASKKFTNFLDFGNLKQDRKQGGVRVILGKVTQLRDVEFAGRGSGTDLVGSCDAIDTCHIHLAFLHDERDCTFFHNDLKTIKNSLL